MILVAALVPPLILSGISEMRRATLIGWVIVAAAGLSGLAFHDISRLPTDELSSPWQTMPSIPLVVFSIAGLYVAHHLVLAADVERKLVASYPAYFDAAWKHAVQLALSLAFVGAFWLSLRLG
jgi:hypothetical protein